MACKTCLKKRKHAVGKVQKRRKRRARVGALSTGAKVALGVLVVGVVAAFGTSVYFKLKNIDKKVVIDGVDITGFSGGKITLTIKIVNLSSVSVPFSGYSGGLILDSDIRVGEVLVKENTYIPAHGEIILPVSIAPNLFALPAIATDFITAIKNKNYSEFKLELNGTIFVGDIAIDYNYRAA